ERIYACTVKTTTKSVVSAPRPFVAGPQTQERVHTSMVQTPAKTFVSAPRPAAAACSGLVGPNLEVPLQKGVEKLSAAEVHQLLRAGLCCLVDVRGDDRASGHIQGAVHEPTSFQAPLLNRVPQLVGKFSKEKLVIFHCQYSLHRGPQCANWYREQAPSSQRVAILEGGFRGWESERLPVVYEKPMDALGQAKADTYALSMGRRVAGAGA
ncbi:ACR2.2, partial [Symbiodinium sp. CCMP2456]